MRFGWHQPARVSGVLLRGRSRLESTRRIFHHSHRHSSEKFPACRFAGLVEIPDVESLHRYGWGGLMQLGQLYQIADAVGSVLCAIDVSSSSYKDNIL